MLDNVTIPGTVASIGTDAFRSCSRLSSLTISDGVTSIGSGAFYECNSLTTITIPSSVSSIGGSAFYDNNNLARVLFMGNAPAMQDYVFANAPVTVYYFNNASGFSSPFWKPSLYTSYATVSLTAGSPFITSKLNANGFTGLAFNYQITSANNPTSYTANWLPFGLSLDTNTGLISGTPTATGIASGVINVVNSTGTASATLTISIIPLFNYTVNGGGRLGALYITITGYNGSDSSLMIPATLNISGSNLPVTTIGAYAFSSYSYARSVTIPASVTSIGTYAFDDSFTFLTSAIFLGNAPIMSQHVFNPGIKVYYFNDKNGFASPTWVDSSGYSWPSVNMGNSSPVSQWLITKGLAYNSDMTSTPNSDGVPLLMSYALKLDPTKNQSPNIPKPVVSGSQMSLTYYAGSQGVAYSVEACSDLQSWSTDGVIITGPDSNNNCMATIPIITGTKCFMRLKVVY